jgi:hypothetical protein
VRVWTQPSRDLYEIALSGHPAMGTVGCLRPITPCAFGLMLGNLHAEKSTAHATIITSPEALIINSMTRVMRFFKCTGGCGKTFCGAFISHFETHLRARNVTLACLSRGGQDILTVDQPTIEGLRQETAIST